MDYKCDEKCIPPTDLCDGECNCKDCSDEQSCDSKINVTHF